MQQFLGSLMGRLQRKGYAPVGVGEPFVLAMMKPASGFGVTKLVGVVANTNLPSVEFARLQPWFRKTMGLTGVGILLMATNHPPDSYIHDAMNQGRGGVNYEHLVCGVYDLASNTYYLPKGAFDSYHMEWNKELFA